MAILRQIARPLRFIRRQLPPFNFITIHYTYFIATCLISAVIFWGSSTPPRTLKVSFTDSLFLTVSAMTLAGLNTVNLSQLNTFQQVMLFILIIIGSAIFVSAFVVQVRRAAFERKFRDVYTQRQKSGRSRSRSRLRRLSIGQRSQITSRDQELQAIQRPDSQAFKDEPTSDHASKLAQTYSEEAIVDDAGPSMPAAQEARAESPAITFSPDTHFTSPGSPSIARRRRASLFSMQGVGARPDSELPPIQPTRSISSSRPIGHDEGSLHKDAPANDGHHFAMGGWISRNSQFHGLTDREREKLGGFEYRAVSFLAWLVPAYFILFQLLGSIGCGAWVAVNQPSTALENGLDPWWVGAFNAVSAFNNSGMSLLDANMVAFQRSVYLLLTLGFFILAGNTAYPIFLRLIVWTMYKIVNRFAYRSEKWAERASTLKFLLDHPRRCYTNLFPSQHTWWLFLSVFTLNTVDWAAFEILNIGNDTLYPDGESTGIRVIDGLFQAFAVRSGGFYVVPIANLRISLLVLYVIMMYISVYPVVITMRNSNVYEERSLGIYAENDDDDNQPREMEHQTGTNNGLGFVRTLTDHLVPGLITPRKQQSNRQFVRQQLRAQLAHDAWTIVLALFLIMIIEGSQFNEDPATFSVFNFLFEIVSGYGCVGISVGLPNAAYSFCGSWHTLSKLILCVVMLRGRHRGLPVAIDQAVLLPGDRNAVAEEDDGRIRLARSMSRGRQSEAVE